MSTKTITITSDAYDRLASCKENNESFSEVISRIIPRTSLLELVGLISKKESDELRKNVIDGRKHIEKEMDSRLK